MVDRKLVLSSSFRLFRNKVDTTGQTHVCLFLFPRFKTVSKEINKFKVYFWLAILDELGKGENYSKTEYKVQSFCDV